MPPWAFALSVERKAQLMLWIRLSASDSPGKSRVCYDSLLRGCSQIKRGIIHVIRTASAGSHMKHLFPISKAYTQTLFPSQLRDKTVKFFTAISYDSNGGQREEKYWLCHLVNSSTQIT